MIFATCQKSVSCCTIIKASGLRPYMHVHVRISKRYSLLANREIWRNVSANLNFLEVPSIKFA